MAKEMQSDNETIELTQEAHDELSAELEERKTVTRPKIAEEIKEARELGDLSENHAYTTAMERKDLNEDRITDLERMLKNTKVVTTSASTKVVMIGHSIEIENTANNRKKVVRLVGGEETLSADSREGKISTDSPIGRAIFKSKIGDVVKVDLGEREIEYKIVKFVK
ncbi:MAG: transcription elongation factor GreA [Candidatus Dojkabacteria bacterium]|nr:transcription elongation factor GreA [Candidatus Dojkabacteria bacterium]MDQ7021679.1 transcription elongation factor GreA [Candidatus Dojkabacteria bacterium]